MFISAAQQSDSVIHTSTFFFIFSITDYAWILNIVPCAVQKDRIAYPFYTKQFASANSKLSSFPPCSPPGSHRSVRCVMSLSLFHG